MPSNDTKSHRAGLPDYTLLDALRDRRSRRFGLGMRIPAGPLAYTSRFAPVPLSDAEEGALAFAACGMTGYALADLAYAAGEGGTIMAGWPGRTVASGDGIQTVALVVINDRRTYFLKRPEDCENEAMERLIELGRKDEFEEFYRTVRMPIKEGRSAPPVEPLFNINANRWSAHAPGTTYFLPINDLTLMYINGLLEIFNETTGAFLLDERNRFLPAGLGRFARSRGGHLDDDPKNGRMATVQQVETFVTEFVTIEQGMMLQNLGLMAQALGLGGFPNFADHEFGWFQALEFRMEEMPASRYLGADWLTAFGMKLLGKNPIVPFPVGLEREGKALLKSYRPPYYRSMTEAVEAVVARKFGPAGIFRKSGANRAWSDPDLVTAAPAVSEAAVAATCAYCEYLWKRYGRFPVYLAPFRTVLGFQAAHLDGEFYDRFYRPGALAAVQRQDFERCTEGR